MNIYDVYFTTKMSQKETDSNGYICYEFRNANTVNRVYLNPKERELIRVALQRDFIRETITETVKEYDFTYTEKLTEKDFIEGIIDLYNEYICMDGDAKEELEDRIEQWAKDSDIY